MLDETVEAMPAPHKQIVERLCTVPGEVVRTAQVLIAERALCFELMPRAGRRLDGPGDHKSNRARAMSGPVIASVGASDYWFATLR